MTRKSEVIYSASTLFKVTDENGSIGELILYGRILSDDEKKQVDNHLSKKWGSDYLIKTEVGYVPFKPKGMLQKVGLWLLNKGKKYDA